MASSFSNVPHNIEDTEVLRRFLQRLVEQVDVAFSNRGSSDPVATTETLRTQPSSSAVGRATESQTKALLSRIEALERKVGI